MKWGNGFFENLFGYEWELTKSPAGANQWTPKGGAGAGTVPDAHDPSKKHAPMMFTTDLSLRMDPVYETISRRFHENPRRVRRRLRQGVVQADAPRHGAGLAVPRPAGSRGAAVVAGPGPAGRSRTDRRRRTSPPSRARSSPRDCRSRNWSRPPGRRRPRSAAPTSAAAPTGRAFASRRRRTGRSTIRPSWRRCCETLEKIQKEFNDSQAGGKKKVSLADLIVLGGCAAVEQAAKKAGHDVQVPFTPGRTDASQEQTDVESFAVLEPTADGFRNYLGHGTPVPGRSICWSIGRTC